MLSLVLASILFALVSHARNEGLSALQAQKLSIARDAFVRSNGTDSSRLKEIMGELSEKQAISACLGQFYGMVNSCLRFAAMPHTDEDVINRICEKMNSTHCRDKSLNTEQKAKCERSFATSKEACKLRLKF